MKRTILAAAAAVVVCQAHGADALTEVIGEPVTVDGATAADLADRGIVCLQAASGNVADKVTPLRDGDTAYAVVVTGFTKMMTNFTARSRMSIQAKDGRFRIVHSDIEQYLELTNAWGPIYTYAGAGGKQAKAALEARSAAAAECMTKKATAPGGDW